MITKPNRANMPVRRRAKERKTPLWKVADELGKTPSQLTIMLRHELPEDIQKELISIIDHIADEGADIYDCDF